MFPGCVAVINWIVLRGNLCYVNGFLLLYQAGNKVLDVNRQHYNGSFSWYLQRIWDNTHKYSSLQCCRGCMWNLLFLHSGRNITIRSEFKNKNYLEYIKKLRIYYSNFKVKPTNYNNNVTDFHNTGHIKDKNMFEIWTFECCQYFTAQVRHSGHSVGNVTYHNQRALNMKAIISLRFQIRHASFYVSKGKKEKC